MKRLFAFILLITALAYSFFSETIIMMIGNAKIFPIDIIFIIAGTLSIYHYSQLLNVSAHHVVLRLLLLIFLFGIISSLYKLSDYGMSSFGDRARGQYYIVLPALLIPIAFKTKVEFSWLLRWTYKIGVFVATGIIFDFVLYAIGVKESKEEWQRFSFLAGDLFVSFGIVYLYVRYSIERKLLLYEKITFIWLISGLFIGQFRTLWVATFCAIAALMVLNMRDFRSLFKAVSVILIVMMILFLLRNYVLPDDIAESFDRSAKVLEGITADPDWLWRLITWEQYLTEGFTTPIFGKGMGAPLPVIMVDAVYDNVPAHNGWLMLFYCQGIIGVLINLITHLAVFISLLKIIKTSIRGSDYYTYGCILLGMQLIQFLYTIPYTDNLYLWMPAAMLVVIEKHSIKDVSYSEKTNEP